MSFFKYIFFVAITLQSAAGFSSAQCADDYLNTKISVGFSDGKIHVITFQRNPMGILTADYRIKGNDGHSNITVFCAVENGREYIGLYKNRTGNNTANVYKYELRIILPAKMESLISVAYVDLRKGEFIPALVKLDKLN